MSIVRDILRLIFPDLCYHCGEPLVGDERNLCTLCLSKIPWTHNASHPDNDTELRLVGRIPVVAAASLLQFHKGNVTQSIVHQIKYHGNTQLAHQFGMILGEELKASHRFDDIDIVAPVPLHWWRRMRRGYNQSQILAAEVAKVLQCSLSVCTIPNNSKANTCFSSTTCLPQVPPPRPVTTPYNPFLTSASALPH